MRQEPLEACNLPKASNAKHLSAVSTLPRNGNATDSHQHNSDVPLCVGMAMRMTDVWTTTLIIAATLIITSAPGVSCAYLKFVAGLGIHLILPIVHQLNGQSAVQSVPEHLHRMSKRLLHCQSAARHQASKQAGEQACPICATLTRLRMRTRTDDVLMPAMTGQGCGHVPRWWHRRG